MQMKSELRKELIEKRKTMNLQQKAKWDAEIFSSVLKLDKFIKADRVLTYTSTLIEVDTRKLIEFCFKNGKTVAVPRCLNDSMSFYYIKSFDELEAGYMGILEPKISCPKVEFIRENDVCITPALAVNEHGYRIGYGKGFYDRFLKQNACISVALCYENAVTDFTQQVFDVPVKILVTETKSRRIYG